jgi:hypothetical protein
MRSASPLSKARANEPLRFLNLAINSALAKLARQLQGTESKPQCPTQIGCFIVPISSDLKVKPGSVVYVGRVSATLRKRREGEFRAGSLLPLIDQAVAGMSGSTWDVTIDNRAEKDIASFRATYPALRNVNIEIATLTAFHRVAVQHSWDGTETPVPAAAQVTAK